MGQRANYVIIEDGQQIIHYNHWRSTNIAADLYLGEKRFIQFVRECREVDVLMDEVWMEGCVIIDLTGKALYFWGSEFWFTSAVDLYLMELKSKWKDWQVELLYKGVYDMERILKIDYISKQELHSVPDYTVDEIFDDAADEWPAATVIIKTETKLHITQTGKLHYDGLLNFGKDIVKMLLTKPQHELPAEDDDKIFLCLIIDTIDKKILVDRTEFGVLEQTAYKWDGYEIEMGDFGYIGALKRANIDTSKLVMLPERTREIFLEMIKQQASFDSVGMAKRLLREDKEIKFSPDFFDNVTPKLTIFDKIKSRIKRLLSFRRVTKQ